MATPVPPLSSNQPDPRILAFLGKLQLVLILAAGLIACPVLLGWLVQPIARMLPLGWDLMKVNTTLLVLGSCVCISFLSFVIITRRSEYGVLSTLVGSGIASAIEGADPNIQRKSRIRNTQPSIVRQLTTTPRIKNRESISLIPFQHQQHVMPAFVPYG